MISAANLATDADAWEFLTTTDSLKRIVLAAVAEARHKLVDERDQSLANKIANSVGRMLTGKGD